MIGNFLRELEDEITFGIPHANVDGSVFEQSLVPALQPDHVYVVVAFHRVDSLPQPQFDTRGGQRNSKSFPHYAAARNEDRFRLPLWVTYLLGREQLLPRGASRQQPYENQAPHSLSPVSALLAM
jgi:hypothetical protein